MAEDTHRTYSANLTTQVRVPKTAELVAGRIRRAIVTGELRTGDSLPSEAHLISDFQVSRPTIREAIRILESEGLISVSRGARGGARVSQPDSDIVARAAGLALQTRGATIRDVYEARMLIEPPAARLAAERRPKEAAAVLRPHVEAEFGLTGDVVAVTQAIADFHRILMEQCGNETLAILALAMKGVFEKSLLTSQAHRPPVSLPERQKQLRFGLASHRKLVELIEAGDGPGAEAHWAAHMENAGKVWLQQVGSTSVIEILD
ncbi:FadR/GntR family transcriptional regulator [Phenylobacterium sp.]|uniref:FadR/GntR family transcriptional regulator n=1 Tax=Phenylobacterium sp. TaxID=1871053 RepID=UPI002DEF2EFE|nr:FadR/GntR family transcriptional regulator [Phenylobacterium sp.]